MAAVFQTIYLLLNENVWILLRFHWSLFPRFEFTIFQHCADQATGHYLKQCWPSSPMHICITQPQLIKSWWNRTKIDLKKIWKICCLWCEIRNIYLFMTLLKRPLSHSVDPGRFDSNLTSVIFLIHYPKMKLGHSFWNCSQVNATECHSLTSQHWFSNLLVNDANCSVFTEHTVFNRKNLCSVLIFSKFLF